MKIAELEVHHDAFNNSEQAICAMVESREFPKVFSTCTAAFPHVVPAIQFRKKRDISPIIPEWFGFSTVCRYAPVLFEHASIELLLDFVSSARMLAKSEKNFFGLIEAARERERLAHRLWNYLEHHRGILESEIRANLGAAQEEAVNILETWETLGILDRQFHGEDHRLFFRTQLDTTVMGRCPNCGVVGKGKKGAFFRSVKCQKCGETDYYYIEYVGP